MDHQPPAQDLLDRFFTEGARTMLSSTASSQQELTAADTETTLPYRTETRAVEPGDLQHYWRFLRLFHHSGKGGGIALPNPDDRVVPLVFEPYVRQAASAGFYPCWVGTGLELTCLPLEELLQQTLLQFAPESSQARVIKNNMVRFIRIWRKHIQGEDAPLELQKLWPSVQAEMTSTLKLAGGDLEDLERLGQHLPRTGYLIDFSQKGIFRILGILLAERHQATRQAWLAELAPLKDKLTSLLAVEKEKGIDAHSPGRLREKFDFADSFLNFEELSDLMPDESASQIPEERRYRLEEALFWLTEGPDRLLTASGILVAEQNKCEHLKEAFLPVLQNGQWQGADSGHVIQEALRLFDEMAAIASRFFSAVRIASLELDNLYDPAIHDHYFVQFGWASFSLEEKQACPPVVVFTDDRVLLSREALAFGKALTKGYPIRTVCLSNPYPQAAEEWAYRPEPGALALAYRDAFVLQTAAIDPAHLFHSLHMGLQAEHTALFHILDPGEPADILGHHAALISREAPSFLVSGAANASWGSRFTVADNPDPQENWVRSTGAYLMPDGSEVEQDFPITPVDYAALFPRLLRHFQIVSEEFVTHDLMLMDDYLALPIAERIAKVPFIWLVLPDRKMVRAAVSMTLTRACEERLGFWHFLQENAGIHNFHAEQATRKLASEWEQKLEQEREELNAAHAAALQQAVDVAGRQTMEDLASILMQMDPTSVVPTSGSATTKPVPPAKAKSDTEEEKQPALPEEKPKAPPPVVLTEEAWIDTPFCTTCNECIDLNNKMFKYNDDKLAYIADGKAGPFAHLVTAAEACPVGIIHPGAPLDPSEPGLEALIERAKPFQG